MELTQPTLDFDHSLDAMQQSAHGPRLGVIFSGQPITGEELKEEGIAKVKRKEETRKYGAHLQDALKCFPPRSRITVEQLTGIVGRPPEGVSPNAVGAIIHGMAKRGLIRKTGRMIKCIRKERHAGECPEWEIVSYS